MRILKKKDINIIIASDEILKEPKVQSFLNENKLKNINTEKLSDSNQYIKDFFNDYGGILLDNARNEFKFTEAVQHGNDPYECQLCGKQGIIKLYQVKNEYNSYSFWVGSSCIKEFGFERGKETTEIALLKVFNQELPNYESVVTIPNYQIIIPSLYMSKLNYYIDKIRKQRDDFIREKNIKIKDIQYNSLKIENLKKEIRIYLHQNRGKEWVVSSKVLDWYEKRPENEKVSLEPVIEKLENDGFYNEKNFYLISERNHLNLIRKRFIELALKSASLLDYIYKNEKIVISKVIQGRKINYSLNERKLFSDYSHSLYNGVPINIDEHFSVYTNIIKRTNNLYNYLMSIDEDNRIESFNIEDDFLLYTDNLNQDYIYKLNLNHVLENARTSFNNYISNLDNKPNFFSKKRFNEDVRELIGFRDRVVCNEFSGIKYNNRG